MFYGMAVWHRIASIRNDPKPENRKYWGASYVEKIHIIGIGDDGLEGITAAARRLVEEAELILGTEHVLGALEGQPAEQVELGNDLGPAVKQLETATDKRTVILTSGDPLFYGVARYLCDKLGKDRFEIVPHVSSMQLAFARVKESWDEAYLADLATTNLDHAVEKIRTIQKAGLFTTDSCSPAVVLGRLLARKLDYFTAYVCENLGSPDERVTHGELADIAGQEFSPPNVLVLVRKPNVPDRPAELIGKRLFGNPDEAFLQSKPKRGLLTSSEVRSMALAEMDLGPASIVWDVGAGSGSVAIEAAQIASEGTTYAIEMDVEDHQLISDNARRFGVTNLVPVLGTAPEVWSELPDPDCIFLGGAGRGITRIVELALDRLKVNGRLVANVGSIENLSSVHEVLQKRTENAQVWMINLARGTFQLERIRFEAVNPSFLVAAVKKGT